MSKLKKLKHHVKQAIKLAISPRGAAYAAKHYALKREIKRKRTQKYKDWFDAHYPTEEQFSQQREQVKQLGSKPLISIVIPIYNTPPVFLRSCIDSVVAQTYDNWQLCIIDDASTEPIIDVVKEYAARDKRIVYRRLDKNQHIAGASKAGVELAEGEFIGLVDHDDVLMPNALYEVVMALDANPKADLIYSDEDKIDEKGVHSDPFFKPDWSPDFLRSCNYITHFSVLRKSVLRKIDDFKIGTEGAQDWDLFLRFTAETGSIVHIPKILYSWRMLPTSTAVNTDSKPYAYINQRHALRNSLTSGDAAASVLRHANLGFWRVRYQIQGNPLVSIVIPTKDNFKYISNCLNSIFQKTSYANFEIIIVDTGSKDQKVLDFYKSRLVTANRVSVLKWEKEFNFSQVCNFGASKAKGEYLVFLNDDTKVITSSWIENMLEHAQRPEVGVVGAKLWFPGKRIQHAGIVLSWRDIAFHPFYNQDPFDDIFTNIFISNIRNCSAVTAACAMVSSKKFHEAGGFDEKLEVTYNDVDFCLKLLDKGYLNVYTPFAQLYHFESVSVGRITGSDRDQTEISKAADVMRERWGKYIKRDPYYNDNFAQYGPGYELEI